MSNALAIAGVTATLRRMLLDAGIGFVTTLPLDKAASDQHAERVNLFLYQTSPNAAWRNREIPGAVRGGESGFPPLALNLYYLLTAYGDENANLLDHRLLGRALSVLHDSPTLDPQEVQNATSDILDPVLNIRPDLHQQIERVRITPHAMNLEEMSKLWATFQTQYRISAAYEVSVVLIDSTRPSKTPLPVTRRGEKDRGWETTTSLGPIIEGIDYHNPPGPRRPAWPSAAFPKAGQTPFTVTLRGRDFPFPGARVLIRDPRQAAGEDVVARLRPLPESDRETLRFVVDPQQTDAKWAAGLLTAAVEYDFGESKPTKVRTSNAVPFALAPRLRLNSSGQAIAIPSSEGERKLITVRCDPPLGADRVPVLLVDSSDLGVSRPLPARTASPDHSPATPTFDVSAVEPGTYRVRLRVDGIDSHVMALGPDGRLEIDNTQIITL